MRPFALWRWSEPLLNRHSATAAAVMIDEVIEAARWRGETKDSRIREVTLKEASRGLAEWREKA